MPSEERNVVPIQMSHFITMLYSRVEIIEKMLWVLNKEFTNPEAITLLEEIITELRKDLDGLEAWLRDWKTQHGIQE